MTEQTYETDTFNRYIPLSEAAAVFQLLNELHDQIKKKPLSELPYYELEDEVCIDDVDTIKAYMEEHPDFFIDAPLFINRTTLFLIACEDGNTALHIAAAHPQADIRMDVVWNLFLKTDDTIRNNDG